MCIRDRYKPVVTAAISEDAAYRNACGHSDRENAVIEGNAAVRRAVLASKNMELIRLYSDVPEFRQRLHREVIDETYPKLHELLRPLSQEDIDTAICAWNGNIESKHAVVRYMKDHAREKDTAAWLAQEYGSSNSPFVVRTGSPEETQLPWPKVQRRLAQLIQENRFYTKEEQDRFDNIDPIAIRELSLIHILSVMSRFHRYSVNNTMLIYMQKPDATLVAGYNKWKDQFERHVKKGEHGITIIAPKSLTADCRKTSARCRTMNR